MASVTKGKSEDHVARQDDSDSTESKEVQDVADEVDETEEKDEAEKPSRAPKGGNRPKDQTPGKKATGGFFTIQKHGQGVWTRVGTAIGAAVLGLMLSYTIFDKVAVYTASTHSMNWAAGSALAFLAAFSLTAWFLTNKPSNVEFLIATDSEMKKVNWTSRKELIGSTRVVVLFMFLVAGFLFSVDVLWSGMMYVAHVLQFFPFGPQK